MAEVLSVSELNRQVAGLLQTQIPLLMVKGEISNFTAASSGHWYFALKDDQAQVRAVMFRSRNQYLDWTPKEGEQVEIRANVTLYEPRGDFQLSVDAMRKAGVGDLYTRFMQLKAQLQADGLFNVSRKRPIPRIVRCIGIITSLQAAALQDVLTTLKRRVPHIPVIIYPTMVQGVEAPAQICESLALAQARAEVDVLLLVRGGGSIEDLWAFNDELVVRAVAACSIPTISGVGHESDITLTDFAADVRAATPTAAAVAASVERVELLSRLDQLHAQIRQQWRWKFERLQLRVDDLGRRLYTPSQKLSQMREKLGWLTRRMQQTWMYRVRSEKQRLLTLQKRCVLPRALLARQTQGLQLLTIGLHGVMQQVLERDRQRLARVEKALKHLNPNAILARGYSLVTLEDGSVVTDSADLRLREKLHVRFASGSADAQVLSIAADS